MDLDSVLKSRLSQESQASSQIQEAIKAMRADVEKSNEQVAERLRPKDPPSYEDKMEQIDMPINEPKTESVPSFPKSVAKKPLVYFSFLVGYDLPPWVVPLQQILTQADYFVYNPSERINAQFGQKDLDALNSLEKKLVKPMCSTLGVNENVLHPFEVVANILDQGDKGDSFASVFKSQWFLTRASVLVSDLTFAGSDSSQELLFAKQLGIPVIGMFPPSGQISPWQHQNCTILYTPQSLQYLIQLIRGLTT